MTAAELVASLAYKPGWTFKLGGPNRAYLCVFATTTDSMRPGTTRTTHHMFKIPPTATVDLPSWSRWVLSQLLLAEQHEACEFLSVGGFRPFFPHHQDEGSPYELVDRWESP